MILIQSCDYRLGFHFEWAILKHVGVGWISADLVTHGCAVKLLASCLSPRHVVRLASVAWLSAVFYPEHPLNKLLSFAKGVWFKSSQRLYTGVQRRRACVTTTKWNPREWKAVRGSWALGKAEGSEPPSISQWGTWSSPARLMPTCWQWMRGVATANSASQGTPLGAGVLAVSAASCKWAWFWSQSFKPPAVCVLVSLLRRDGLSKCGKCKQAYYCNVECQVGQKDVPLYALGKTANIWAVQVVSRFWRRCWSWFLFLSFLAVFAVPP